MPSNPSAARLVLLVTAAVFINYIDRGNLATAAPLLQDDLHLSASQLGYLLAAFYYGYVACMPAMGWLAERYGAKRILAAGVTIWSVATLTTGFAGGFMTLLALRVLLGVGESVAFPCASKVLAQAVEVARLGVANGILSFGYLLGPAVGTLLGGYLMTLFGWRPVFVAFGAVSLLWLWPWLRAAYVPPAASNRQDIDSQPSFAQILGRRELWGASLGHFSSNYGYYFIVSWLPYYLVKSRGFSMGSMVAIASWAYLLNALSALAMGWLADRWIRAGRSPTVVYKAIMAANHIAGIACMIGMVMLPAAGSIAALFIFEIVSGCSYPGLFAIPQILAGPRASARWVGIQNAAGNVAGLIAPAITGVLVDQTGLFDLAFALAAGVNVLGLIGWVFMLAKIAPIEWAPAARIGVLASLCCLPLLARAQSAGCGTAGLNSGTYTLAHHGLSRSFRLYVPPQYRRDLPARVVFLFHGWGGNEDEFLGHGEVIEAARARGYILVAPRGLGSGPPDHNNNSWTFRGSATGLAGDAPRSAPAAGVPAICDPTSTPDYSYRSCKRGVARNSCAWTQCQDDDVLYTLALAHYLEARLCIDTAHVFAAGGSNGGMFTWELGQNSLSALTFRAIAPIIGLPHRGYLSGPGKPGTMPVILITGLDDAVVPPGNWDSDAFTTTSNDKDRYYYTGATAITRKWAAAAGCNTRGDEHSVTPIRVADADCRTFCPIEAGHWPAVMDCRAKMGHDYGLPWSWKLILDFFDHIS